MADSSKTEKATPKKRQDERKKGNIFQSRDVVSAFSILSIFFILKLYLPYMYQYLSSVMTEFIGDIDSVNTLTTSFVMDALMNSFLAILILAGPVMLVSIAIAVLTTGAQTKFKFSKELLKFKFNKLNPIEGFKRMISIRSLVELLKSMLKITVIGYILYNSCIKLIDNIVQLMYQDVMQALVFILDSIMDVVIEMSLLFIAIAAADYFYQWWDYERNLKMTKQEIKEEYKQQEGDPFIKGKIREKQRQMSMSRMMQQVPTADVIVRNPTHFAVALKYDIQKNRAPIVVAKGQDYMAMKILEIAQQSNIPMTENKPLARALYDKVPVNREIPEDYYAVLAEILAWVYSMKKETNGH